MDHVDVKYIGLLSTRLEKFKKVKPSLFNFRCPICGDSQRNKTKTRGYLYSIKNNTNFKCHNCGASMSFNNFLKQQDSALHKQYTLEKFKQDNVGRGDFISAPENILEQVSKKPVFLTKQKIDLPRTDEVKKADQFLNARKIRGTFYYAEKFLSKFFPSLFVYEKIFFITKKANN